MDSEETNPSPLKQIRTYQGDIADALHNQNESIVSIQRAEAARNMDRERVNLSPAQIEQKKSVRSGILLFVGIIVLLALGSVGGYFAYKGYKTKTAVPVAVVIPNTFFAIDKINNINARGLNRESLIQTISEQKTKSEGNIVQLQLLEGDTDVSKILPTENFLDLLGSHATPVLVRAFDPLFMLGLLKSETTNHTFLLIKLDSYENAFPGMLAWEQNLSLDLLPLFASPEVVANIPTETPFVDVTLQNKDARILKDPSGQTVLLYSFFDNNMLIITDNEATFKSLLTRLASQKLVR